MKKILSIISIFLLSLTLVACGDTYYTVTFDVNGGEPEIQAREVKENDLVQEPGNPSKENYIFQYWVNSETMEKWIFETHKVTKDITLLAIYKEEVVNVNFDLGYEDKIETHQVTKGSKIEVPNLELRKGYRFDGWYIDSNFETLFDFDMLIKEDITIFAKWYELSEAEMIHEHILNLNYNTLVENNTSSNFEIKILEITTPYKEEIMFGLGMKIRNLQLKFNAEGNFDSIEKAQLNSLIEITIEGIDLIKYDDNKITYELYQENVIKNILIKQSIIIKDQDIYSELYSELHQEDGEEPLQIRNIVELVYEILKSFQPDNPIVKYLEVLLPATENHKEVKRNGLDETTYNMFKNVFNNANDIIAQYLTVQVIEESIFTITLSEDNLHVGTAIPFINFSIDLNSANNNFSSVIVDISLGEDYVVKGNINTENVELSEIINVDGYEEVESIRIIEALTQIIAMQS